MKTKIFIFLLTAGIFLAAQAGTFSQNYEAEGNYSVGKTSCTIEWDTRDRVFKVYWSAGIGNTTLFYDQELPNGNAAYNEYDAAGSNLLGTFTFKDDACRKGIYTRHSDLKEFTVKKKR